MRVTIREELINWVAGELGRYPEDAQEWCEEFVDRLRHTGGLDQINYSEIKTTDDLEQAFADRKQRRHDGLIQDVLLAALCCQIGGGKAVAYGASTWTAQHINRLAKMVELPEELLDPELAVGVYHVIAQNTETAEQAEELLRRAIAGDWSVADAKEALGVKSERTAAPRFKATIRRNDGGEMVLEPDEPPPHWFDRAEVREVAS